MPARRPDQGATATQIRHGLSFSVVKRVEVVPCITILRARLMLRWWFIKTSGIDNGGQVLNPRRQETRSRGEQSSHISISLHSGCTDS